MCKNCDNCYWNYKENKGDWCGFKEVVPKERVCDKHDYECISCSDQAEYKYKGDALCSNCLLEELGVETYTVTHYTLNDEYLGSDDDISEVINNIADKNIQTI